MKSSTSCLRRQLFTMVALFGLSLTAGVHADVIFEADFNGPGAGTGSDKDLVTKGGKGEIFQHSTAKASVKSNPTMGQGSFFSTTVDLGFTPGLSSEVTFTPATPESSWAALQTIENGGVHKLNGGADFFIRLNDFKVAESNMVRPLDFGSTEAGGIRFVLNFVENSFQIAMSGPANAFKLKEGTSTTTKDSVLLRLPVGFSPGMTFHVAFTFHTDSGTGQTTMKLFARPDAESISTSSSLTPQSSVTFTIDPAVVTTGLSSAPFMYCPSPTGALSTSLPVSIDADVFRIYNSAPSSFSSLAEAKAP